MTDSKKPATNGAVDPEHGPPTAPVVSRQKLTDRASFWIAVFALSGATLLFFAEPVIQRKLARRGVTSTRVRQPAPDRPSSDATPPGPRSMFDGGDGIGYSLFWLKTILLVLGLCSTAWVVPGAIAAARSRNDQPRPLTPPK